jgi:hypothetical protein
MIERRGFHPLQAEEIARAFNETAARSRGLSQGIFRVASLRDIIASKRASGRQKDQVVLPLLESFRQEYERLHAPELRSASEIAGGKNAGPA